MSAPKFISELDSGSTEGATSYEGFSKPLRIAIIVISTLYSLYAILFVTLVSIDPWRMQSIYLALAFILGFMLYRASGKLPANKIQIWDWLLLLMGVASCIYIVIEHNSLIFRIGASPTPLDLVFGAMAIMVVLEITRRATSAWLALLTAVALVYIFFGSEIPGLVGFPYKSPDTIISFLFAEMGIFGIPISVMASYIFLFMLFATFLQVSGVLGVFIDIAMATTGMFRGGPAKAAVVASAFEGTVTGSAVANVVGSGSVTIPLMKSIGYPPHFAGAVEAAASSGGQIMPPVMGASAFIMAGMLGIGYDQVCIAAAIPAILYFLAVFLQVDLEAVKLGLKGMPRKDLPRLWPILKKKGYMLLPIVILVLTLMVLNYSIVMSAIYSIISVVVVSMFNKKTRMGPRKLIKALSEGAISTVSITAAAACAGIIIGVISLSGLGVKGTSLIMSWSGGINLLALLFVAVICLILGMGLPTAPAYIIAASVAAPSLKMMGIDLLSAHMFIFYFAFISAITPPVAMAAYAAAGIAGASMMKTGWTAARLGLVAFTIPFVFVYHKPLLMDGTAIEIILTVAMGIIALAAAAMGLEGESFIGKIKWNWWQRLLFLAAFVLIIIPDLSTTIIGLGVMALTLLSGRFFARKVVTEPLPQ